MSTLGHADALFASWKDEARAGRKLLADQPHEAGICDEVGHEPRPVAGGRVACVCCGVPLPDACTTPGTFREGQA